MNSKVNYNPDVLDALANLSNDEVFTPPKVVNKVLDMLPADLWSDKNATFLDPASKSGVFLREIAKRLIEGLENEIPNLQERIDHIFTKQLFGIAITDLTSLVSRRTLYCSKYADGKYAVTKGFDNPDGNIVFDKIEHEWKNGRCTLCGASKQEYNRDETLETYAYEFIHRKPEEILKLFSNKKMKFDVIVGNPPYQSDTGGTGKQATPIYHYFVQQAKKMNPRFLTMIIPARWYNGGMGLKAFRKNMLTDNRIRKLVDYPDSGDCFPGVLIKGGICYFLWDRDNKGLCEVTSYKEGEQVSTMERPLLEKGQNVFVRYNQSISILKKVLAENSASFSKFVNSIGSFGLPTQFDKYKDEPFENAVKLYANNKIGFIELSQVLKNKEWVDEYKILITEAYGAGETFPHQIINKPFIVGENTCCTATYLVVGPFESKEIAEKILSYMKTKFFRFLVMLNKSTQHATSKVYKFVPLQDFSETWTDKKLYKKYNLTQEEIDFIESMIRPMD
jgi:site-specific DNA-methyltransferase (adenine-specific)